MLLGDSDPSAEPGPVPLSQRVRVPHGGGGQQHHPLHPEPGEWGLFPSHGSWDVLRAPSPMCVIPSPSLAPALATIPEMGKATWEHDPVGEVAWEGMEAENRALGALLSSAPAWCEHRARCFPSAVPISSQPFHRATGWAQQTSSNSRKAPAAPGLSIHQPLRLLPFLFSHHSLSFPIPRLWRTSTGGSPGLEEMACLRVRRAMPWVRLWVRVWGARAWG